jgi:tetratricopeptide (TPR) repeat protein
MMLYQPKHRRWEENPSEELVFALEHMNSGKYELAIRHTRRAIEMWPDYFDAWLLLGSAHEQLNELDEALDAIQRASEIAVESLGEAWNNLASLHIVRGEYEEALTVDRVLDLVDPTRHGIIRYRMGIALSQLGQRDAALEALSEAFEFRPDLRARAAEEPLLEPLHGVLEGSGQ